MKWLACLVAMVFASVTLALGSGVAADATTDADPPVITFHPNPQTPPPAPSGWYRDLSPFGTLPFVVDFVDPSGLLRVGCTGLLEFSYGPPTALSSTFGISAGVAQDGVHTLDCLATDKVGNAGVGPGSSPMPMVIRIDRTPPTLTCPSPPRVRQRARAYLVVTVSDATSGPASATVVVRLDTRNVGRLTIRATGLDAAGNESNVVCAYTVCRPGHNRFGGRGRFDDRNLRCRRRTTATSS